MNSWIKTARCGVIASTAALVAVLGCTLNSRGEAQSSESPGADASIEASAGAGGTAKDASAGGSGGTDNLGGMGGTGGTADNGGNAGMGGTAGTGGTADNGGSAGTGGVEAGVEDCLNQIDDDGDTLIDCKDPDCDAGYQCVDPYPAGWQGYCLVNKGPYDEGAAAAACPPLASAARYFLDPDETPACTPCECGKPEGFICGSPHIVCSEGHTDCDTAKAPAWDAPAGCATIPTNFGGSPTISCQLTGAADMVTKGSCAPSISTYPNLALWKTMVDTCSLAAGGGCDTGACVARPSAPYPGPMCIRNAGKKACPNTWPVLLTVYSTGLDERKCGACDCDASPVACIGGAYTFYDTDNCADCDSGCDAPIMFGFGAACQNLTVLADSNQFSAQVTSPATASASCVASGGAPTGKVKSLGEMTICCKQP